MDYEKQFSQLEESLSEYEICVHCLSLGKEIPKSLHSHQDTARSPIDSELICLPCFNLQEKRGYKEPKLSEERKREISEIVNEFYNQRGKSLDNFDDF